MFFPGLRALELLFAQDTVIHFRLITWYAAEREVVNIEKHSTSQNQKYL